METSAVSTATETVQTGAESHAGTAEHCRSLQALSVDAVYAWTSTLLRVS